MDKLASMPKKDRDEIASLAKRLPDDFDFASLSRFPAELRHTVAEFDAPERRRQAKEAEAKGLRYYGPTSHLDLVLNNLGSHANHLRDSVLYRRVVEDAPTVAFRGLRQAARLEYLVATNRDFAHSGGHDCLHVWPMERSAAADDAKALDAYLSAFPRPAAVGHPMTIAYANAYKTLWLDDPGAGFATEAQIEKAAVHRETGKFFGAMLQAILAVRRREPGDLELHLGAALSLHRRLEVPHIRGMLKFVCLPAHGIYNVARRHWQKDGTPLPTIESKANWDYGLDAVVASAAEAPPLLEYAELPGLRTALETLPKKLDLSGWF